MTKQSKWVPKDPPLQIGETVVVTSKYSPLKERQGQIAAIVGPFESPHMRTDRWMADWFLIRIDDVIEDYFLEDEIERP